MKTKFKHYFFTILNIKRTSSFQFCFKRSLSAKIILNFMHGFKNAILHNWKIVKMALLAPCMKFNFFCPKDYFWSITQVTVKQFSVKHVPPNSGFRTVIVENWDFLKKDSQDFLFIFRNVKKTVWPGKSILWEFLNISVCILLPMKLKVLRQN